MKILIIDDHTLMRKGLKQILEDGLGQVECGEAQNTQEGLGRLEQESWDAVLLDINMPGGSGFDVLKEVKEKKPKLPVLVLSAYPEDQLALRTLKAGASGYLNKSAAADELIRAMHKVLSGGKYITPILAEKIAEDLQERTPGRSHERLSAREFQVLQMITAGRLLKDIATELSVNVKTVSTFRFRILKKLGLQNNVELTRYAIQHGLIEPPGP